jgi:hypothetical protein
MMKDYRYGPILTTEAYQSVRKLEELIAQENSVEQAEEYRKELAFLMELTVSNGFPGGPMTVAEMMENIKNAQKPDIDP